MAVKFRRSHSSSKSRSFSRGDRTSSGFSRVDKNKTKYHKSAIGTDSEINSKSSNDSRSVSSSLTLNGSFVGICFFVVMLLLALFLVYGSFKHEPMDMITGIAKKVSNYGTGFKGDLEKFSDIANSVKRDDTKTYTLYFQGHYIDLPDWSTKAVNSTIDVVKFLLIVPFAIGSLSIRFVWFLVDVIGFCLL